MGLSARLASVISPLFQVMLLVLAPAQNSPPLGEVSVVASMVGTVESMVKLASLSSLELFSALSTAVILTLTVDISRLGTVQEKEPLLGKSLAMDCQVLPPSVV